jgi:hypothetical protein
MNALSDKYLELMLKKHSENINSFILNFDNFDYISNLSLTFIYSLPQYSCLSLIITNKYNQLKWEEKCKILKYNYIVFNEETIKLDIYNFNFIKIIYIVDIYKLDLFVKYIYEIYSRLVIFNTTINDCNNIQFYIQSYNILKLNNINENIYLDYTINIISENINCINLESIDDINNYNINKYNINVLNVRYKNQIVQFYDIYHKLFWLLVYKIMSVDFNINILKIKLNINLIKCLPDKYNKYILLNIYKKVFLSSESCYLCFDDDCEYIMTCCNIILHENCFYLFDQICPNCKNIYNLYIDKKTIK